ncbi:MAG: glycoside hydrolase family 18 [Firmicutes bacterium]|nr:glycoside hydrolase family 18 [Bacillota bacterium]
MNLRRAQITQTLAILLFVIFLLGRGELIARTTQAEQLDLEPLVTNEAILPSVPLLGPAESSASVAAGAVEPAKPAESSTAVKPAAETAAPAETPSVHRPVRLPGRVVLGYYAEWGSDRSSYDSFRKNVNNLSWVAPFWYSVDRDGQLRSQGGDQDKVMDLARASGKKVIVLFNNLDGNDTVLRDPAARQRAVENIVEVVLAKGYDGVNIDFENLEPASRKGLTQLMADLSARLWPAGRLVTVAVAPKLSANEDSNNFAAAYDYAALGRHTDYVVIMSYDQHARWSEAGPVADFRWVQQTIRYAITQIPAEQILLGIAGYGYDWSTEGVKIIKANQAEELANWYGAKIQWDKDSRVPYFAYTQNGVRHEVWYEDYRSVEAKLELVSSHGLGGVALWRLGQEEDKLWPRVAERLN